MRVAAAGYLAELEKCSNDFFNDLGCDGGGQLKRYDWPSPDGGRIETVGGGVAVPVHLLGDEKSRLRVRANLSEANPRL